MSGKCKFYDCQNASFKDLDKCALHCKKSDYSTDWHSGLISQFYKEFKTYILDFLNEYNQTLIKNFGSEEIEKFLNNFTNKDIKIFLKQTSISPGFINFPVHKEHHPFNYTGLLNVFGQIYFNSCHFHAGYLSLDKVEVFFQDCQFHKSWALSDYQILENVNNIIYQNCIFNDDVYVSPDSGSEPTVINNNHFDALCVFNGILEIRNTLFKGMLFNISAYTQQPEKKYSIRLLKILDSKFSDKFILNDFSVKNAIVNNTVFEQKFEFKNNIVECLDFDNVDFEQLADFHKSEFKQTGFFRLKFNELAVFEGCVFDSKKDKPVDFVYTTFFNFINFRFTKFKQGLNLERTNFSKDANFLGTEINPTNTNRETLRIIKQNFESSGNKIEADRYFALELEAYKKELKINKGSRQERFILGFNNLISGHGQSIVKAAGWWIFIVAIIALVIINDSMSNQWLNTRYPGPVLWQSIRDSLNGFAQGFLPFSKLYEGREHLSFFIMSSAFFYQL